MIMAFLRFELREQLRSPLLWLLATLYALLAFAALASDAVQIGGGIGNVLRNAPTVIATLLGMFTLLGLLVTTLFVSNAVLRDFDLGTAELVFSTPVRRRDYLIGRLGAALIACMIMYVVIALGMFIAQFMPWIDQARLGPVAAFPYLWSLLVLVLPNLLFTTALLALLAVTTRNILWVYIGVIVFFVLYGVSRALLADLDNVWIATLADPLGIRALSQTLRYWSVEQRNQGLPPLSGYLLANRALWLCMSALLFAAMFSLFRTERSGTGRRRGAAPSAPTQPASTPATAVSRLTVTPQFGVGTAWKQLLRQIRFDTLGAVRSAPFLVLLILGLANFIPTALFRQLYYGTAVLPVTSVMLEALQNSYSFLLIIVVLFYAGELVWKERSNRIDGITDAMPVPDWVPLLGKFVALLGVIASFQLAGALTSIALQLGRGYTSIEPLLYLKTLALGSVLYVLMGGMALALQVLSNNKFVGYALLMLVLIGQSVLSMLDYAQNLYTFGGWPNAPYSDMNGFGHFLPGQLWFQGYWGVFMLALLLLSSAFWPRGMGHGVRQRVRQALQRLRSPTGAALAVTLLGFAAVGGWLYWNTNVYNSFLSPEQRLDLQARYERDYRKYKDLPQPRIVAIDNHVDLHPETQSVVIDATWTVRNTHTAPISEVHIGMQGRTGDRSLVKVDLGGQTLTTHDVPAGYRIYRLQKPLQPGEERVFRFRVDQHPHGLTAEQAQTELVANGSFFNNTLLPWFGYNPRTEISDRNDRRKRGLGEPTRMPKLEDQAARANTYVSDDADWLDFASTVCTAPDQIALAPGYLQREFQRDGRRCFRYVMDRPMLNFYAYLSARWQVRKARYKDIPIEIYYDPKHPYNVQRMIESVQKSLAYYEAKFSPYQHHQVRIVEFPGYARFAQSFANTIPYAESIGFIADLRDKNDIDYVFYVTAHEVAHQWWAHQVIGANVQGATMLSESLAQYSALMVMEREYGRAHMRRFLKYELDRYLEGRGGESIEELPLYRVEDQQYIHYRKGSLAFYRLREDIGEQALNRALQRFLAAKAFQQPPYTTSAELLQTIRTEARPDQQGLITDLFERITFYDNRVVSAQARKRPDGRFEVMVQTQAAKLQADGTGKEHAVPLDDWIEVAIYGVPASENAPAPVLALQRQHVTSTTPSFTMTVDRLPIEAGFDPDNKLIDRVPADNRKPVTLR
ncbi:ABC transporter permease/M1 family aminopeptidase [Xanthomonas campestris]|uniref:ABC transporter permease/M1 family aminopeptidase n=1 Tax=Xanthomonas campestris TaxID=339 RepID=UPI002B236A74|nr:M1 family aminopeptidase [Xanthomonas campestris]MEA9706093.1 M1 family aminopeptidase [Xanthomonas campestris pv. raphani]MEA9899366.1 M1 family aminopeptidase [Xanthomonas campestris pv. raphani]